MKHVASFIIGMLLLTACSSPQSYGQGMMGGNGGGMMQGNGMMDGNHGMMDNQGQATGLLPGQDQDIASLPQAKASEVLEVQDGATITLNPTIVRKTINGKEMAMYGYNGEIPGPLFRVKQGATFTVNVTNDIDVPTTVHWHGIRVANRNDGTDGVTQDPIAPGASYRYVITVPDEGLYWYHTHVREDMQQPMGLYGGILVTPATPNAYAAVDEEKTILLNDLLVDENGNPVPYGADTADHTLMGRFGNLLLVNGDVPQPLQVGLGSIVRLSILNASNTRTYRVVQPRGSTLKIVGGDSGRYEKEYFADSYTLAPSERVTVEVYFWDDGVNKGVPAQRTVTLVEAGPPSDPVPALSATIAGGVVGADRLPEFKKLRSNADVAASIDSFRSSFDKAPDHTLVLGMDMMGSGMMDRRKGMMGQAPADGIEWEDGAGMMNMMGNMMKWQMADQQTGAANKDLEYTARVGDKVKFRIMNKLDAPHPMQHPIHFHGNRFLVLSDNGVKNDHLVWKDTVLVPAGHTVDILLDASNPGDWMFHCHIAEHLSNGMMGMLKVVPVERSSAHS